MIIFKRLVYRYVLQFDLLFTIINKIASYVTSRCLLLCYDMRKKVFNVVNVGVE